jgi:hypothetical protein
MPSQPDGGLVLLKRCADNIEASSLRSLLDAHDIQCFLRGEQHRSMLGLMGSYVDVDVLVASSDLLRARSDPDRADRTAVGKVERAEGADQRARSKSTRHQSAQVTSGSTSSSASGGEFQGGLPPSPPSTATPRWAAASALASLGPEWAPAPSSMAGGPCRAPLADGRECVRSFGAELTSESKVAPAGPAFRQIGPVTPCLGL